MFRRSILFTAGVLLLSGLVLAGGWSPKVVQHIEQHSVGVVVFFDKPGSPKNAQGQELISALIGSGVLLPDDYVLTVRHLMFHPAKYRRKTIYVIHPNFPVPFEADIVTTTTGDENAYDYAVIRTRERLGYPGVKVGKRTPDKGEPVAFGNSLFPAAFFLRFGTVTTLHRYYGKNEKGGLQVKQFHDFPFLAVSPGGSGDSGSGIFNTAGELVGIGYERYELGGESFLISNSTEMLHRFLREALLGKLVPR